ncbi:MAG: hypothetical protein QJ16_C0015G0007 [archaeon GW2011_AR1]|nr:MAG: hypothetical protein QJ16_C0015G0007 [archaeon GW2011_AR1]
MKNDLETKIGHSLLKNSGTRMLTFCLGVYMAFAIATGNFNPFKWTSQLKKDSELISKVEKHFDRMKDGLSNDEKYLMLHFMDLGDSSYNYIPTIEDYKKAWVKINAIKN